MSKKKGALTLFGLLAILGTGAYTVSTGDINFGTIIGHQGDNNYINNYILDTYGVDIQKFREGCLSGKYTDNYCDIVT